MDRILYIIGGLLRKILMGIDVSHHRNTDAYSNSPWALRAKHLLQDCCPHVLLGTQVAQHQDYIFLPGK